MLPRGRVEFEKLSGRRDLNPRPLDPQSSALPSCATSRNRPSATSVTDPLTLAQDGSSSVPAAPVVGAAVALADPNVVRRPHTALIIAKAAEVLSPRLLRPREA